MKLFVTEKDGPVPDTSARKKHVDPLDKLEDWMKLKAFILSGKAKPMEAFGIHLYPSLDKVTGVDTRRTARDRMRRFLKAANLQGDYHIKWVTPDENDLEHKFMRMWYEPPFVAQKKKA